MHLQLKELVFLQTGIDPRKISDTEPLFGNPTFSSLDREKLLVAVMDTFNINVPPKVWESVNTINHMVSCLTILRAVDKAERAIRLSKLSLALLSVAGEDLPDRANYAKQDFYPLNKIESFEELVWTLEYVSGTYKNRVRVDSCKGMKYLLFVDEIPAGHPVFLLATLYVLLVAGADIYVRYAKDVSRAHNRILDALVQNEVVHCFEPRNWYSDQEVISYVTRNKINRVVFLGDAANTHNACSMAKRMKPERVYFPSAHLLIVDYAKKPEHSSATERFGNKCWCEVIDYNGYPAPTHNKEVDFYVGFDYDDLFWGAADIIDSWNELPGMNDKIPAIIFTDRPREQAWLPEGIEKCCTVTFIEDYDSNYPIYDFTQLLR